jgi:integrase
MGSIYRRKWKNPDGTVYESEILWIKYRQNGRTMRESTEGTSEAKARKMLRSREGDVEHGIPIDPQRNRITFDDAAKDLENEYEINGRKTLKHAQRRIKLHLKPTFGGKRLASISTDAVRAFCAARKKAKAANAEINRETALLKRMFTLALQEGKTTAKPYIPMLKEDNVRRGFFERESFDQVRALLPVEVQPVVTFAYLTGWRRKSEILGLQWRQVDFEAREVRLDPGTTKNGQGRVYPFTAELETLLKAQHEDHKRLKKAGTICPYVFHREGERIKDFKASWKTATKAAGCPGRILHDFRRTAVRSLERAGVPRSAAMAMVGHKTEAIYQRYAIVDAATLREAASKIDEANGTEAQRAAK